MAGVQRVATDWLAASVAAFRLSNGRVISVPAEDLDQLGRACFAASIDWRTQQIAARDPIEPQPGPSPYFGE